jgi:hypothetical protein
MAISREFPNGMVVAYYGNGAGCQKQILDAMDYREALTKPDAAMWSLTPQGPVTDNSVQRNAVGLTGPLVTYSGYYGNI